MRLYVFKLCIEDMLGRAKLRDLHVLLLGGGRFEHVARMAAGWRPKEIVKCSTGRFGKRLYCGRGWGRYCTSVKEKVSGRTAYASCFVGWMRVLALPYRRLKDKLNIMGITVGCTVNSLTIY